MKKWILNGHHIKNVKLKNINKNYRKQKNKYPDLRVQLDVFDDQKDSDEELVNQGPPGIDLSSHIDIFYAILGQIADTPQEIPFLSILQHLLRLDPKEAASDLAWDTAETLVHRATLLESRDDVTKLLRSPSLQTNLCCHCRGNDQTCGTSRKASIPVSNSTAPLPPPPLPFSENNLLLNTINNLTSTPTPPPPPPPPPTTTTILPTFVLPPPPPPPPLFANVTTSNINAKMEPPLPPPLQVPTINRIPTPEPNHANHAKLLPQQEIPTPKTKMKTINWNKIPNHKVIGKKNIWSLVADDHQNSPMADLDWSEMEGLFCQQVPLIIPQITCTNGINGIGSNDAERKKREPTEIALLDGKRSLNVNIFLKQFRSSNENIIQLIRDGGHDDIGAEKLRGLLKILPEVDELEMLKTFDGDKTKLGNAEKFFLQLIQVPNYKLRIECMLLKEEFSANMSYLEPSINSMILAGEDLMTNKPLQEVLYMVLVAGNFLNSGGYAGNAAGVKLSSLQKLTEIRANKPGMNLIHFVALQAEKKRKDLLNFARNLSALEAATKTTIEQLTNEFNTLDNKIKKINNQIQLLTTEIDIQEQMAQFLQMAEQEMGQLKRDMEELEGVRKTLAEFFCEDSNTFKIEECFKIFHQFCQKFNQAIAENERRKIQEEQINARRKQREEQLIARKRMLSNQADPPPGSESDYLMDYGIMDIQSGFSKNPYNRSDVKIKRLQNGGVTSDEDISITGSPSIRRRLGSCSGGPDNQLNKEDTYSPDITPNGTLRRRRSRIPCEEDDGNLMDFLRTTGQDNTRERKSWGSLDRSWARRARGQPRRGDLLNADFSGDRERPNSPSPLAETKPFLQEEETKPTGRAWRQKIEAWLTENEKEERAGEELQRKARQLQANRKSFEDSENEGKISTDDNLLRPGYSDVYDWRPSVEKTDVMRTMEAIEEAQPHQSQTNKSSWRKTSLTVPSNNEDNDPRYTRRLRTRLVNDNVLGQSTLQAIREEERKKNKTNDSGGLDGLDELTIYLRQPNSTPVRRLSKSGKRITTTTEEEEDKVSDKIEIDCDNIETPPVTRRVFSPPREIKSIEKELCKRERCTSVIQPRDNKIVTSTTITPSTTTTSTTTTKPIDTNNDLGSGNFDRYSAARKTRRYKKNQDNPLDKDSLKSDNSTEYLDNIIDSNTTNEKPQRPRTLSLIDDNNKDSDAMLRIWQDKLKRRNNTSNENDNTLTNILNKSITINDDIINERLRQRNSRLPITQPAPVIAVTNTVLSPVMQESHPRETSQIWPERAVSCRERHRSMIDPSQVREALRITNNPPNNINQNSNIILRITTPEICHDNDKKIIDKDNKHIDNNVTLNNNDDVDNNGNDKIKITSTNSLFKNRFIPDICITNNNNNNNTTTTTIVGKTNKESELNDEGFEETQSLVSETLSQETSSGNYETDTHDSTRCSPADMNYTNKKINNNNNDIKKSIEKKLNKKLNDKIDIKQLKITDNKCKTNINLIDNKTSYLPKKKIIGNNNIYNNNDKKIILKKNEVERSGSKSSLRSSRSSLNSSTSVNTVKKLPSKNIGNYTTALRAMTNSLRKGSSISLPPPSTSSSSIYHSNKYNDINKKLSTSKTTVNSRIPASRSSSSGSSSIGQVIKNNKKIQIPTSEVKTPTRIRPIVSTRSNSTSNIGNHKLLQNRTSSSRTLTPTLSKTKLIQPRNHSFMRPTTASVNKGSTPNISKTIKTYAK
ncbi:uncharacterized protein LOC122847607 isoform X1 [Aphidius gifuensis]|uniref:uncharacterized protein LOC122847607 isoform X1 n=1 Tax=Aphidius gifuensis TaxID=684658 RepID=UPI001CDC5AAD|nr:uncharacterized protein LOC122847607 isoform X1 [Aphidius gifuensis]